MIGHNYWEYLMSRKGCKVNAMVALSVMRIMLLAFLTYNFNTVFSFYITLGVIFENRKNVLWKKSDIRIKNLEEKIAHTKYKLFCINMPLEIEVKSL